MKNELIPIVQAGQALMSLRDSGYSFPAAVAEIIDNSIEADATSINIELYEQKDFNGKKAIDKVCFYDDGGGMDSSVLHKYLVLGHSTRYMREDTIGKYGVGAKLAALNFALKIECWSRDSADKDWEYVSFDLEEALENELAGLASNVGVALPTHVVPPSEYLDKFPLKTGTVVVWSKIDRLVSGRAAATTDEMRAELNRELGRIFRKYIFDGVNISINGKVVPYYDPLMRMEGSWSDIVLTKELRKTNPNLAPKRGNKHFPATLIAENIPLLSKGADVATLSITLYPREVLRERGKGGDHLAKKLRVDDSEGLISFMRLDREISYTNVPRIFPKGVMSPDRFIGIEVSFSPKFDRYFGVRNVKRGVEPFDELRNKIRGELSAYISTARSMIQDIWGQMNKEDKEQGGEYHPAMEAVAAVNPIMPPNKTLSSVSSKSPEEVEKEYKQELKELAEDSGHGDSEEEIDAYVEKNRDLPLSLNQCLSLVRH
ncbi:hypothetical protein HJZ14_09710 [Vibrio parahaemolyticus]|nr:hypothetical protein [Vibrio parahaemolyticus]MBE4505474.1 hypothetical protein [Vibrio parahaemolyticus]